MNDLNFLNSWNPSRTIMHILLLDLFGFLTNLNCYLDKFSLLICLRFNESTNDVNPAIQIYQSWSNGHGSIFDYQQKGAIYPNSRYLILKRAAMAPPQALQPACTHLPFLILAHELEEGGFQTKTTCELNVWLLLFIVFLCFSSTYSLGGFCWVDVGSSYLSITKMK